MTTTADETLADVLDTANPNNVADALKKVKLGTMLSPLKVAIVQTDAVTVPLDPPALLIQSVRVSSGTAISGLYRVADTDGTEVDSATLGVCTISDDGATLTFDAAVEDVTVIYIPRSDTDLTSDFNVTGQG